MNEINFAVKNTLGIITLNRPKALNAINLDMIRAIKLQLAEWKNDRQIHSVFIHSTSERAFCAGGDIKAVYEARQQGQKDLALFFKEEYALNEEIKTYPKPYIALMNGITMGGGIGISIHGSLRIATTSLLFAMPETGIGFFPDVGASYFLSRTPFEIGTYMALTGYRLNAQDAYFAKFIDTVISPDKTSDLIDALSQKITLPPAELTSQPSTLEKNHLAIQSCFDQNTVEDIYLKLESHKSDWAKETLAILQTKCPLSLKIALEEVRRAKNLSFHECMQMEYCLAYHFMQDENFFEGVRALIIDKDNRPQWQPNTLGKVDKAMIDRYFSDPDLPQEKSHDR